MLEIAVASFVVLDTLLIIWVLARGQHKVIDHGVSDMARLDATVKGALTELHEKSKISHGRLNLHDVEVILNAHYNRNRKD